MNKEIKDLKDINLDELHLIIVKTNFSENEGWFEYKYYTGFTKTLYLDISDNFNVSVIYEDISMDTEIVLKFTKDDLIELLFYIRDFEKNVKTDIFNFDRIAEDINEAISLIKKLILKYVYE